MLKNGSPRTNEIKLAFLLIKLHLMKILNTSSQQFCVKDHCPDYQFYRYFYFQVKFTFGLKKKK